MWVGAEDMRYPQAGLAPGDFHVLLEAQKPCHLDDCRTVPLAVERSELVTEHEHS